jgi:tetratricopeptide (TPR) repeat protein
MSVGRSAVERLQQSFALAQAGQLSQSKNLLRTIMGDRVLGGQAHALLGQILSAEGQHLLAQKHLCTAIKNNRTVPEWHSALGDCLLGQQRYREAIKAYNDAVGIESRLPATWFNIGICNKNLGFLSTARDAFQAAMEIEPNAPDILNNLGSVCFELNEIDAATNAYEAAAKVDEANSDILANLALCYEVSNRPTEAEQTANAALELQQENSLAILVLGRLKMQLREFLPAIKLFDQTISQPNSRFAFSILMNKAQCYDRLGDYDAAYQNAELGHDHNLKNPSHQTNMHAGFAAVRANERFFLDPDFRHPEVNRHIGERMPPVFFIGFPRSGTTLVERMLAHHPDVFASSEMTPLDGVLDWLEQHFPKQPYPDVLRSLKQRQLEELRQVYWGWMDNKFNSPKEPVFVDKMPMNILAVGLINLIFPDSKILCALRDPRDVIVSCYFQDFSQNMSTSTFNSLPSTAEYYNTVMDYWIRMKPNLEMQIHEYRYEDLVVDGEKTLKKILEFIGLNWRSDSFEYRTSPMGTQICTPSRAEVNQPISSRAVGRWKNYAGHIQKLENSYKQVLQTYYN